jgi:CBS domain-containing protein
MLNLDDQVKSRVIELTADSLSGFCDDISGMFGIEMSCKTHEPVTETAKDLKKRFKKMTAVTSVAATGELNGRFHSIIDQGGLFTMSGVIVMLPENRIKEEIHRGDEKEAIHMRDAVTELGNLLAGTFDRIFREGMSKHGHFAQCATFIGKPWLNPQEAISLPADEEFLFIPYEMTIGTFPTFNGGVILPDALFQPEPQPKEQPQSDPQDQDESASQLDQQDDPSQQTEPADTGPEPDDEKTAQLYTPVQTPLPADESTTETNSDDTDARPADNNESDDDDTESGPDDTDPPDKQDADEEAADDEPSATLTQPQDRPVSTAIRNMVSSAQAVSNHIFLSMTAQDIMETQTIWIQPDDTVQNAIDRMQQNQVGYLMVGSDGNLQGIVSRSDVAGAVSPYLRPVFTKWKRPLDEATLQIKVSWIMTRPVRTITPNIGIDVIADTILRFGIRALPVVGSDGKVKGIVTTLDVMRVLASSSNLGHVGKTVQMPAVV